MVVLFKSFMSEITHTSSAGGMDSRWDSCFEPLFLCRFPLQNNLYKRYEIGCCSPW